MRKEKSMTIDFEKDQREELDGANDAKKLSDQVVKLQALESEMLIKEQDVESAVQITKLEREYEEFLAQTKRQLEDVLAKNFPDMESAEEIRSHIWQDHPVWSRLNKLEEDVSLLKSNIPPSS